MNIIYNVNPYIKTNDLQKSREDSQKAWDEATNSYSRYPSAENWQRFLECKKISLNLREEKNHKLHEPEAFLSGIKDSLTGEEQGKQKDTSETTDSKIYDFLSSLYPQMIESKDIIKGCGITKDQMRHGLLKLLKQKKIEKIRHGYYQGGKEIMQTKLEQEKELYELIKQGRIELKRLRKEIGEPDKLADYFYFASDERFKKYQDIATKCLQIIWTEK